MNEDPLLSVVICTQRREHHLTQALSSLTACQQPEAPFEVLVVDNGPTVRAEQIVSGAPLPCRYISHPPQGLSTARNRGVDEARGTWLLFLDDDVSVQATYLERYARSAARHADAGVLGGAVEPELLGDPPAWLSQGLEHIADAYAARPPVQTDQPIEQHTLPYGANFAIRRDIALHHRFDEQLGRHPDRPFHGGEELDVMHRILKIHTGWWVAGGDVHHRIEPERQTDAYLGAYFLEAGRMAALGHKGRPLRQRMRLATEAAVRWLGHAAEFTLNRPARRARNLREAAWQRGFLTELMG